jgi:uncharacterized protein YkwD
VRIRLATALVMGSMCMLPQLAAADALEAANWERLRGCGVAAGRTPLQSNSKLQQAAKRYADGASLQSAMAASDYLATQSTAIHLTGPVSDVEIQRLLRAHYCPTLQDPQFRDFGAERRGRDLWMVLGAPVTLAAPGDASSVNRRILSLVNEARAAGHHCGAKYYAPVGPLMLDPALTRAALEHSRDMAAHDVFDHRGHDGSTPGMRVDRAGFGDHRIVGENIAAGAMTPGDVTQGWLASPAHCQNIMDGRFTLIGIAYAENLHTRSAVFWTQDFAAHRLSAANPQSAIPRSANP